MIQPYIKCLKCGRVNLSETSYWLQLLHPNLQWVCPKCGIKAKWGGIEYKCVNCNAMIEEDDIFCSTCFMYL